LTAMGRFLDASDTPAPVDCVLVLGGDHDHRPQVAAALFKAGLARQVLVPVLRKKAGVDAGNALPSEEIVRCMLIARGVPIGAIVFLDGEVDSTSDEATALARYLDSHRGLSIAVVTTDYHTRRARWTFQRHIGDRASSLRFIAAPAHGFDATNWWHKEDGFVTYLNEYVKLGYYCVRGG
jgi:uncharacterized SAM-binding protein YcdF (DUF218 family)